MTDWKSEGGAIINKSGKTLIVAMDNPNGKGWAYMLLSHNRKTSANIDADGFRVLEEGIKISFSNPGTARFGWWKIRNGMLATVYAGKDAEGVECVNFEVELKNPSALLAAVFPPSIIISDRVKYAVGSAVLGPAPKTNEDFGWPGAGVFIAESSIAI